MNKHPLQKVVKEGQRVTRFVSNGAVRYLLDKGTKTMNDVVLAFQRGEFDEADLQQFYQLIGYSIDGYAELDWISRDSVRAVDEMVASQCDERDAKIRSLQNTITRLREGLRRPVADLYGMHEDDFGR